MSKRKSCIEPFDGHLHIFHALLFAWHFPCLPAMCSPRHYASGIIVFCQLLGAQCTLPDAKGFSCSRLSSLLLLLLLYAGKELCTRFHLSFCLLTLPSFLFPLLLLLFLFLFSPYAFLIRPCGSSLPCSLARISFLTSASYSTDNRVFFIFPFGILVNAPKKNGQISPWTDYLLLEFECSDCER